MHSKLKLFKEWFGKTFGILYGKLCLFKRFFMFDILIELPLIKERFAGSLHYFLLKISKGIIHE